MKDKKGFLITGMVILAFLAIVGVLVFLISSTMRWYIIGGAILVGMFYVIGKMVTSKVTTPKIVLVIILLVAGLFFILGASVLQVTFASTFTPVYCNDYSFICCKEFTDIQNQQVILQKGETWECPQTATRCTIELISQTAPTNWYYINTQLITNNNVHTLVAGDIIENQQQTDLCIGGCHENTYVVNSWRQELRFTGRSTGGSGTALQGSSMCTFNPGATYTNIGKLLTYDPDETSYVLQLGDCKQVWEAGDRHICANLEEQCDTDTDCGGHTYGNYECQGGNKLIYYGCTQLNIPSSLTTYSDGVAYSPFSSEQSDQDLVKSRCELVPSQSRDVGCCSDAVCGSNAFCDTDTWTCETTKECTTDDDCKTGGLDTECDFNIKQLKEAVCLSDGTCGWDKKQDIECCSDIDCSSGYFCDTDYKCKESIPGTKQNCPNECCVGETEYFDRDCPSGEFCVDNLCSSTGCTDDSDCANDKICEDRNCIDKTEKTQECGWWETPYEKDVTNWKWYNYLSFGLVKPEVTTERGCKTAGWFVIVIAGGIVLVLGVVGILVFGLKSSGKKRNKK